MIDRMSRSAPPSDVNLILAVLRWIALFGALLGLALHGSISGSATFALLVAAIWSALLALLPFLPTRLFMPPFVPVLGDFLLAGLIFLLAGGFGLGVDWIGLLPIFSAALYYNWQVALGVAAIALLVQGALGFNQTSTELVLFYLAMLTPIYGGVVFLYALLGQRLRTMLEIDREKAESEHQKAEKTALERRSATYKLLTELGATLNYQRVLETALDLSSDALAFPDLTEETEKLVSAVLLFNQENGAQPCLQVGSARHFSAVDRRVSLPALEGLLPKVIDGGEPRLAVNLASDPELSRIIALHDCQSAYCIPLRAGLDTCGVLLFAHPLADFFSEERREVLDLVGNQATIALENARLYQDLALEKERMMEVQEETRKKMARDLHDGPTQSVAAIAMRVNFVRRLFERDPKTAVEELSKIEDLARQTTKEIRHMLFTLRPLILESKGLAAALESMAQKIQETYGQVVQVTVDPEVVTELDLGKQGVVFYVLEEAVTNARKHAQAPIIYVRVKRLKKDLALAEVQDNGIGFDLKQVDSSYQERTSLGMLNMRERVELVNGLLHMETAPGKGTRIQVFIPLTEEAADRIRRGL